MRLPIYFVSFVITVAVFVSSCDKKDNTAQVFRLADKDFNQWNTLINVQKVTQLKETDSCLMSYAAACAITDDHIIYEDYKAKRIYTFTPDGDFLHPIGDIGRSSSEYINIRDIVVTEDGNEISVADDRGIVSYNVHTGNFLSRVSFSSSEFVEYERFAPVGSNRYLCFTDSRNEYSIVLDTPEGQIGLRKSRRFHFVTHPFYRFNGNYRVVSDYGDFYIDSYENGELRPLYEIDLGEDALPNDVAPQEFEDFCIVNNSPEYFKCITHACETTDWLCLELVGPDQEYYIAFIDKNDGSYAFGKENVSLGISVIGTKDEMFCGIIYPEFAQPGMLAKKILDDYGIDPERTSPVVIYFKLNEKQ